MATYKLNEIVNVIPSYDGKEEKLKLYIRSAKSYYNGVAANERKFVLDILLSNLSGKAIEAVGDVDEIETLDTLVGRLNEKIPEAISYTLAHTQLQKIVQAKNESVNDYATRFEEALNKLKKAATQARGASDITEAIGKTLFIQNMTDKNLRLVAASSNATTTKEIIKYVKEKELILGEKPTQSADNNICGFCSKPNHIEKDCTRRKYAQKLLKITPSDSKTGDRHDGNYRNNFNKPFNNDRRFDNRQSSNDGNRSNNEQQNGQRYNGNGNRNRNYNDNYSNRNSNGYNGRDSNNYRNDDHQNGGSSNSGSSNGNYNGRSGQNYYRGNNRNPDNGTRNNGPTNNQRTTLNSQNSPTTPEDDVQVSLRELRTHAQFHAQNSEN